MSSPVLDVAIIGGGIAGLSAAYELHRRGLTFVVLERASRAGGVIFSEQLDGFTVDAGPDALLVQKPDGIKLCEELGLGDRLVSTLPPRIAYIQRGGRLHGLPAASVLGIPTEFGPFIRSNLFSWRGKLRMGAEVFVGRRDDETDESIGSFMRRRFGDEAVAYLAEPLLAGIHAGDVDRLSIQSLFPRFVETEHMHGSLLRAFRHASRPSASGGAFRSLPGGLSEMVAALVRTLPATSVRINSPVEKIAGTGPYRVDVATAGLDARAVILATPAFATARLLADRDRRLADWCDAIPYASTGTVAMAFTREAIAHPLNGSGYVVPRVEGSGILATSWLSSKWPHRAPEGRVLLRTFVGGGRDPQALERSDRELIERSLAAITPVLGVSGVPLFTRVYRWERASAQHEIGHRERLAAIDGALAHHPGLYVTGSGFRGVGIPDCVADARRTARQAAEWLAATRTPEVTSSQELR